MIRWECSQVGLVRTFRDDCVNLLTPSVYDWRVIYGFRSIELQEMLYERHLRGGPLAAPPDKSAHCRGLAIDLQLYVDGIQNWNVKAPGWIWLFRAIMDSPRLHSGIAFGDFDHVERYNWRAHVNDPVIQ